MGLVLLTVGSGAARAATMEVQIHISGRGTVIAANNYSCTNDNPDPAAVKDCPSAYYSAPDPTDYPAYTFTASTDKAGWKFSQWTDLHFTSCSVIIGNMCTIEGRQNSFVVRPATVYFTRDAAPPSSISLATTTDHSATFEYAASEGVNSRACALEDATGRVVASGCDNAGSGRSTYDGLASGLYKFRFHVTDFFGHDGEATRDVAVLQTSIADKPPAFDSNMSPRFTFASPGATAFRCSISGGILGDQECGVPFTTPVLRPDGPYTMSVYAVNGSFKDPSPATYTWYVDTTAPTAAVTQPAEGALLSVSTATLVFDGTDNISNPADLRYECRLDDDAHGFTSCANPYTTPPLATGLHWLDVRSLDQAGHRSATVRRTWRVDFPDVDGDGYHSDVDCNDANSAINPGAAEILDNPVDENCDGVVGVNLDRDGDGFPRPADCNDKNEAINPGAAEILDNAVDENCDGVVGVNLDRDGDGFPRPADCNDNNAAINPGAFDIPGNGVDEDCADGPAGFPRINAPVFNKWQTLPHKGTKVLRLRVSQVPPGGTVQVRCTGRGCPFKSYKPRIKTGKADATSAFKRRRLASGAVVEVRVTAPAMIGTVVRFTMRSGTHLPEATLLCSMPGASKPVACG
jgi:hypothetical protein